MYIYAHTRRNGHIREQKLDIVPLLLYKPEKFEEEEEVFSLRNLKSEQG